MRTVAAIVNERPIFLRSNLSENAVEELGIGFVQSADQILRIAESHESGLLIRDAHKCQVATNESDEDVEDIVASNLETE